MISRRRLFEFLSLLASEFTLAVTNSGRPRTPFLLLLLFLSLAFKCQTPMTLFQTPFLICCIALTLTLTLTWLGFLGLNFNPNF